MQVSASTSVQFSAPQERRFDSSGNEPEGTGFRSEDEESGLQSRTESGETTASEELTPEQQRQIQQLQIRDQQVKDHEAAHMAASGGLLINPASFTYQAGPDGQRYAIGGEVTIDVSPVSGNPEATIRKAQQIQAAALAPADPSVQDRAVAASAVQMALAARAEVVQQQEALREGDGAANSNDNNENKSAISSYQSTFSTLQEPPESVVDQMV